MPRAYVASHAILFASPSETRTTSVAAACDICGGAVGEGEGGRAAYLVCRGDDVYIDTPPLCVTCGAAIGVMALSAWTVEEEEG